MANIFEMAHQRRTEGAELLRRAKTPEEWEQAREIYTSADMIIDAEGDSAWDVFRAYDNSRNNGNDILDFSDYYSEANIAGMIEAMKENEIKRFTLSSGWTNALQIAEKFVNAGCRLMGMTQVKTSKDPAPALLFEIK